MTGLGTRQIRPMLPSRPRILAIANPCLGSSQTRLSTSHSASDSECSSSAGMPKGYEIRRGAARPAVLTVAGTLQGRRSAAHDRGEPSWGTCLVSERLSQLDVLVAEVGGDLQRAAECCHVGGEGPDLGRAGLGATEVRTLAPGGRSCAAPPAPGSAPSGRGPAPGYRPDGGPRARRPRSRPRSPRPGRTRPETIPRHRRGKRREEPHQPAKLTGPSPVGRPRRTSRPGIRPLTRPDRRPTPPGPPCPRARPPTAGRPPPGRDPPPPPPPHPAPRGPAPNPTA